MKIAIIGAGGMGRTHIENLRHIADARITELCDANPAAQELARTLGAAYYADYRTMLENSKAEIVMICTPTFLHYEQVRAALLMGKHCICEKPLCFQADQARELLALARRQGVRLFAAHVMIFWEQYAKLADFVRQGTYGRVLDAELHRLTERPAWLTGGWLFERDKSGLLPYDLHIHDLYFLTSLFGKPRLAYMQHGGRDGEGLNEYLRVCYEYPNLTVCAEASWYHASIPFTQGFRFYFEKAVVAYDGAHLHVYECGKPAQITLGGGEAIETDINVPPSMAYFHELEHFLDCARRNAPSELVTEEQIIWTLEMLEEIVAKGR